MRVSFMSGEFFVDSKFTLRYSQATTEKAIFHVSEPGYFRGLETKCI
jgi:hypothetical protein